MRVNLATKIGWEKAFELEGAMLTATYVILAEAESGKRWNWNRMELLR